jgi:signal transduction histidine kinase/CheY-like chemotaxis protein
VKQGSRSRLSESWRDLLGDFLEHSTSIHIGVLSTDGDLIYGNDGFQKLLVTGGTDWKAADYLINPDFETLLKARPSDTPIFNGLMTIGNSLDKDVTLKGTIYHKTDQFLVLGEQDTIELERLNKALYKVTQDINVLQRELLKEKSDLELNLEVSVQLAETLREAKAEADRANAAKSGFISSMSHELRTPLNAVLGFGQLLKNDPQVPLTEDQADSVTHIINGGEHLLGLIDEVLELSKVEAGMLSISVEDVSALDVVEECLEMVKMQAGERAIEISNLLTGVDVPMISVDYGRLRQILLNLLSNAIKYNQVGGKVAIGAGEAREGFLKLEVSDTGFGISAAHQADLFEPFNRLGRENQEIQGTGIGLTISKQMVELMNGHIGYVGAENEGSTFWIELPLSANQGNVSAEVISVEDKVNDQTAGSAGGVLLYVEDNATNMILMQAIIDRHTDRTMLSAKDAEHGLKIAMDVRPDIILMDINLSGMSGIDALQKLRENEATKDIPVIAVSAAAMGADVERGMKAGFNKYVTKPVQVAEILEAIRDNIA